MATRIPNNATVEWSATLRKYFVLLHFDDGIIETKYSYDTSEDAEISKKWSLRDIEQANEDIEFAEWAFPS